MKQGSEREFIKGSQEGRRKPLLSQVPAAFSERPQEVGLKLPLTLEAESRTLQPKLTGSMTTFIQHTRGKWQEASFC